MKSALRASKLARRDDKSTNIYKDKSKIQKFRGRNAKPVLAHIEKFSGDAYKSKKGKGDVIKAGKLEPFSYIQLNPRLLNKRNK